MQVVFASSGLAVDLSEEVVSWASAAGSGMMDAGELLHLAATLALFPWGRHGDAVAVEIGAFEGATTVFMARVLRALGTRAPVLSIDPFERAAPDELNPQGVYSGYMRNVRDAGFEDQCLPLVAFSEHAAAVVPERVGILVVDGSHHYAAVKKDLELFGPKVLPGGLVFVDDYVPAYAGVMRAADESFGPGGPFEVLHKSYFVVARRTGARSREAK